MIDFRRGARVIPTRQAIDELLEWCEPARRELGLEVTVPEANGAQRAQRMLAEGASIADAYRASVAETGRTYVPERVPGA
jgi:hypothetical protein